MVEFAHTPIMVEQCLALLAPSAPESLYVDLTTGEGGHSFAFASRYADLRLACVDADERILERAKGRLAPFAARTSFWNMRFDAFLASYPPSLPKPDRILADLGISMWHYEASGRGFSFSGDEDLDMRLDPSEGPSAADLVNGLREDELADLIYRYGEERHSRRIARAIAAARRASPIRKARELADIVRGAVPPEYRRGRIHPATRSFQALRIACNDELGRLSRLIPAAFGLLPPGGRLAIISFHSLEDSMVKAAFRDYAKSCVCPPEKPICECGGQPRARLLTKSALKADQAEVEANPASRSARLRVLEKLGAERGAA
jgi:16S rRNA (cytosine1402-N4)-methyltransferase